MGSGGLKSWWKGWKRKANHLQPARQTLVLMIPCKTLFQKNRLKYIRVNEGFTRYFQIQSFSKNVILVYIFEMYLEGSYKTVSNRTISKKNFCIASFFHSLSKHEYPSQIKIFSTGGGDALTSFFHRGRQNQQKTKFLVAALNSIQSDLRLIKIPLVVKTGCT